MNVHDRAIGEIFGTLDEEQRPEDIRDGLIPFRGQFHDPKTSVPSPSPSPKGEGNLDRGLTGRSDLYAERPRQFLQPPGDVLVELVFRYVFHAGDLFDGFQVDDVA